VFEVAGIHHSPLEDRELLRLAALAESRSTHPIARSILSAWGETPDVSLVTAVREIAGQGVEATVEGRSVLAGNDKLMQAEGITPIPCGHTGTVVHIARDGEYLGHILISDQIKPGAQEAVAALKRAGVSRTVMLTGDRRETGEAVARELGVDEAHTELMPGDKVAEVERLLATGGKGKLAFVGDGINDAPVLSRADIGIAMGALGSDAAIEAADVVLMDDDPRKISVAIRIARTCLRIVYENIWFAIGVKLLCLLLGALGIANMWAAIFADVGVMVLAVLNAVRILLIRDWRA
ncbi:MAG: HAD-IC family P-type ATPase, partial [Clostridia bacterium]|nr:HAD-IC family P-type ATPase [Clostridia bacterium]